MPSSDNYDSPNDGEIINNLGSLRAEVKRLIHSLDHDQHSNVNTIRELEKKVNEMQVKLGEMAIRLDNVSDDLKELKERYDSSTGNLDAVRDDMNRLEMDHIRDVNRLESDRAERIDTVKADVRVTLSKLASQLQDMTVTRKDLEATTSKKLQGLKDTLCKDIADSEKELRTYISEVEGKINELQDLNASDTLTKHELDAQKSKQMDKDLAALETRLVHKIDRIENKAKKRIRWWVTATITAIGTAAGVAAWLGWPG